MFSTIALHLYFHVHQNVQFFIIYYIHVSPHYAIDTTFVFLPKPLVSHVIFYLHEFEDY